MGRTVILRHSFPNGDWHLDWMVEADRTLAPDPDRPLVTFRTDSRLDEATVMQFRAERIGDHRAEYLTYEGPVSGGRGRVERLAVGTCRLRKVGEGRLRAEVQFSQGDSRVWEGAQRPDGFWHFAETPLAGRP